MTPTRIALLILSVLGFLVVVKTLSSKALLSSDMFREYHLITAINRAESPGEKARLIDELEELPEKIHSFSSRWLNIHAERSPGAWNETGFDHRRTETPRDIELLAGTSYGVSDIFNGGLLQFFGNHTGGMAPEMIEWFERAGLSETARILKEAMTVFGEPYPRSQDVRLKFLEPFKGDAREDYDPFYKLDGPFYDSIEKEGKSFRNHADHWLRETCGIESLHTKLPPVD